VNSEGLSCFAGSAILQVIPRFFGILVILKTRANAEISTHADDCHHTVINNMPSFNLLITSSDDWRSVSEVRGRTIILQHHFKGESPFSVVGAIKLHVQDRMSKGGGRKRCRRPHGSNSEEEGTDRSDGRSPQPAV
jgi:hypothetical protein